MTRAAPSLIQDLRHQLAELYRQQAIEMSKSPELSPTFRKRYETFYDGKTDDQVLGGTCPYGERNIRKRMRHVADELVNLRQAHEEWNRQQVSFLQTPQPLVAGEYHRNGDVIRLRRSKVGALYGERFVRVTGQWKYEPNLTKGLTSRHLAEAHE